MPRFRLGGGGGGGTGGAGLALGPETNEFISIAARDNYATANADWLAEYDANTAFLVAVTISGTTTYVIAEVVAHGKQLPALSRVVKAIKAIQAMLTNTLFYPRP